MSDGFNISLPIPFSAGQILKRLNRSSLELLHQVERNSVFKRIPFNPEDLLCQILFVDDRLLEIHLLNGRLDKERELHIRNYLSVWFDLSRDLKPFYKIAEEDHLLSRVLDKCYGLRLVGVPDLFEALSWAIIGQQINLRFAYILKRRLIEAFGEKIEWNGRSFWRFPAASAIAQTNINQLTKLSITHRKSEYLREVATRIADGLLSMDLLNSCQTIQHSENALTQIRGIGSWTANYVLMHCIRHTEAFPVGDAGLQNAVKKLLSMDRKPTEAELRKLAKPWKGWEAYATFYLWNG